MIAEAQGSTFEVLNAATGALLYSYKLPAPVEGAVSVARGKFFVDTLNGTLYALGPQRVTAPRPDRNCPKGFTCRDIGNSAIVGSESTSGGVLSVTAAGAEGFTGESGGCASPPATHGLPALTPGASPQATT